MRRPNSKRSAPKVEGRFWLAQYEPHVARVIAWRLVQKYGKRLADVTSVILTS